MDHQILSLDTEDEGELPPMMTARTATGELDTELLTDELGDDEMSYLDEMTDWMIQRKKVKEKNSVSPRQMTIQTNLVTSLQKSSVRVNLKVNWIQNLKPKNWGT